MIDAETLARGRALFEKSYGDVLPLPAGDPDPFVEQTLRMFAHVFSDPTLPLRDKRLLIIGALAGLGADASLFDIHARSALRNGELTADELNAAIVLLQNYVGFPRASMLYQALGRLIANEANAARDGGI